MRSVDLLVVGAGASGMMASITAARSGSRVVLLEKMARPGKKLLATGNGRCNYTNERQDSACYRSQCVQKAWQIIQSFHEKDTVAWFHEIGVLPGKRQGYLYPASFQAAGLLHSMEREMERLGIELHREEPVERIERQKHDKGERTPGYVVTTNREKYLAGKVIISTGGMASPVHGSTGDGYDLVRGLFLKMIPVHPALCGLVVREAYAKKWAGNRIQGKVSLQVSGETLAEEAGEIQLVNQGISGIPVFQLSRFVSPPLEEHKAVFLYLDSMPDYSREEILKELRRRVRWNNRQSLGDLLEGMLPDKFSHVIIEESGHKIKDRVGKISENSLKRLRDNIKAFPVKIHDVAGFERAQVTAGGISLEEIDSSTMEVRKSPGLYLTGELLDVDGICGGYNLQWAWTTGYLAGKAAGRKS